LEEKTPLGGHIWVNRWEDNIQMDLREIWWGSMAPIDLAYDRDY
jgi:hypothetical protein